VSTLFERAAFYARYYAEQTTNGEFSPPALEDSKTFLRLNENRKSLGVGIERPILGHPIGWAGVNK
jgi:hypothetical protein